MYHLYCSFKRLLTIGERYHLLISFEHNTNLVVSYRWAFTLYNTISHDGSGSNRLIRSYELAFKTLVCLG